MALKLIASYSKRLGLPAYSSHQFSVTIEAELTNVGDVAEESSRLYETLQRSVDEQIQQTGFVPQDGYGSSPPLSGQANGSWLCSNRQRELILKLIDEHQLDKADVEALARERFNGKGVKQLNKLEASGLIDELFEKVGERPQRGRRSQTGSTPAYRKGGAR